MKINVPRDTKSPPLITVERCTYWVTLYVPESMTVIETRLVYIRAQHHEIKLHSHHAVIHHIPKEVISLDQNGSYRLASVNAVLALSNACSCP